MMSLKIAIGIYVLFVAGFLMHTLWKWRESERLFRVAREERERREAEIEKARRVNFPNS